MNLKDLLLAQSNKKKEDFSIAEALNLEKDAAQKGWEVYRKLMTDSTGWHEVIKGVAESVEIDTKVKYALFLFIGGKIEKGKKGDKS